MTEGEGFINWLLMKNADQLAAPYHRHGFLNLLFAAANVGTMKRLPLLVVSPTEN